MNITGRTAIFGLIGHPVRHSLSPAMHNALLAEHGIDAVYVAFDVFPDRAHAVADAIRTLDVRAVNLTVPFKSVIVPQLDSVTRAVEEAGAANVVVNHDGHLTGYNTDGEGFVRGFEAEFGRAIAGRRAVILGAGGAARAVGAGLADRGARSIVFANRTPEHAAAAASHLAPYFPAVRFDGDALDAACLARHPADLVVNCTAGGAQSLVASVILDPLAADAVWCDTNYWMAEPPALAACRARGLAVQTGLAMLAHQGALSFELFTGVPVDAAHIRARLQ